MTLGFMSLVLALISTFLSSICIPRAAGSVMLPCKEREDHQGRRLSTSADKTDLECHRQGMLPLIPAMALHQLHMFIFFMAIFHVCSAAMTLYLGRAKMRIWKQWEKETLSPAYKFIYDPSHLRLARQTTFVMQHSRFWSKNMFLLYIASFIRQFLRGVQKTDYLTLRHGYIAAHLSPGARFNFQDYIKRKLENDFRTVFNISLPLWASILVVLLINVHGSDIMLWLSAICLLVVLSVGTKLQAIIEMMAVEIREKYTVVQGMPVVKLSDDHFWFGKPGLVLHLITFASLQNAFGITHFCWIWFEFGWRSCFHEDFGQIIVGLCLRFVLQFMLCYSTLPLYGLVSQMGSWTISSDQSADALNQTDEDRQPEVPPADRQPELPAITVFRRCKTIGGSHDPVRTMLRDPESLSTHNDAITVFRRCKTIGGSHDPVRTMLRDPESLSTHNDVDSILDSAQE